MPTTITEKEFEKFLEGCEDSIAYYNLVRNIKTKECLGYGFVFFSDYSKAEKFILNMNGKIFKNKKLFFNLLKIQFIYLFLFNYYF